MAEIKATFCPKCITGIPVEVNGGIECGDCGYKFITAEIQNEVPKDQAQPEAISQPIPKRSYKPKADRLDRLAKLNCPVCGMEIIGPQGLGSHMRKHKNGGQASIANRSAPENEPNKYTCLICSRDFDTRHGLSGHMATHKRNPSDVLSILDNTEKAIRNKILEADDGMKAKYKTVRLCILEAIEILL